MLDDSFLSPSLAQVRRICVRLLLIMLAKDRLLSNEAPQRVASDQAPSLLLNLQGGSRPGGQVGSRLGSQGAAEGTVPGCLIHAPSAGRPETRMQLEKLSSADNDAEGGEGRAASDPQEDEQRLGRPSWPGCCRFLQHDL